MSPTRSPLDDPVLGGIHAAVFSDSSQAPSYQAKSQVMGTTARITTVGGPDHLPHELMAYLAYLDSRWSRFIPESDISRLNNEPGRPVLVAAETLILLSHMNRGFRDTRGDFDPTTLPAVMSEGYVESLVTPGKTTSIPSSAQKRGDLAMVAVDGNLVTLPVGTTIDSGGVGKGLAADLAASRALELGALGALVEVGGDVRVSGVSPRGDSWRLAIEHPTLPKTRLSVVELTDHGLATSTVTKRRFTVDGRSTHHLINPKTLQSADSDTIQASVIAPTAALAEMWTKVAFVRGSATLLAEASARGFEAACWLTNEQWVTTPGWINADA